MHPPPSLRAWGAAQVTGVAEAWRALTAPGHGCRAALRGQAPSAPRDPEGGRRHLQHLVPTPGAHTQVLRASRDWPMAGGRVLSRYQGGPPPRPGCRPGGPATGLAMDRSAREREWAVRGEDRTGQRPPRGRGAKCLRAQFPGLGVGVGGSLPKLFPRGVPPKATLRTHFTSQELTLQVQEFYSKVLPCAGPQRAPEGEGGEREPPPARPPGAMGLGVGREGWDPEGRGGEDPRRSPLG